jgi:hypothetical protein
MDTVMLPVPLFFFSFSLSSFVPPLFGVLIRLLAHWLAFTLLVYGRPLNLRGVVKLLPTTQTGHSHHHQLLGAVF